MLENIIFVIHILLILFILIAPFSYNIGILVLHLASVVSILIHWSVNNDACFLTMIETNLRGVEKSESFIHNLVSPVYNFSEKDVGNICYITLFVLGSVSAFKIFKFFKKFKTERYNKD